MNAAFPEATGRSVLLANGEAAVLRGIGPGDAQALRVLHRALSSESRYFRYFSWRREIGEAELERFTQPDHRLHEGVVGLVAGQVVAHACFDRAADQREAEVAFEVADAWQHRGLGTLLVEELAERARRVGIERFLARVLPDTRPCLQLLRDLGFTEHRRFEDGTLLITLDLTGGEDHRTAAARRRAQARSARSRRGAAAQDD
jgi:GNAT superfamily N-acetyltransferase